jgi:hypothetical protein
MVSPIALAVLRLITKFTALVISTPGRRLLVQPSQACTTVWRAIFPPLSSTIAEQKTLVPSGYAQLCVKARRLPTETQLSTLCVMSRPQTSSK